ncbi:site-specific tyrosine recombinase XerS (plasmid) [Alkalihalophilus pseudofirmus OF4]|uniref:Site-specific tyrosine recombinase XerS n=1 Tax=Alkalihalophilus pseudofirmus (strain ATCC BAA-2126 / JCM 17055 / OF4) TaxID=398511 RepID=D3G1X9_ALKPO|nr:helix-turn-helix domain-containing protein [Alkalihalophilus pseudofirmus]ADC52355.1 site-specific tyrosine recombinase XerS [Alkalihalophilus pseudofirmus OF4]
MRKIGEEVKRLREIRGMTQGRLAKGICNQSEIARIELGRVTPSFHLMGLISSRLNVPIEHFLTFMFVEREAYFNEVRLVINGFLDDKNYNGLYEFVKKELNIADNKRDSNICYFLEWNLLVAKQETNQISIEETISNLQHLVVCIRNSTLLIHDWLLEQKVQNSLAIYLTKDKQFQRALDLYQKILSSSEFTTEKKFLVKVYYNYSKTLYILEQYQKSYEITVIGINLSIDIGNFDYLGQLFYQRAQCREKLEHPLINISEDYFNALFIFKQLKKEALLKLLIEKKSGFFDPKVISSILDIDNLKKEITKTSKNKNVNG